MPEEIKKAIHSFQEALKVNTLKSNPREYVSLQKSLGVNSQTKWI